jgi:hypothetical protein
VESEIGFAQVVDRKGVILVQGEVTVNTEERAIVQRLSNQNTEVKSFFTTIKVRERTTFIPSAEPPADQLALALPAHSPASIAAQDSIQRANFDWPFIFFDEFRRSVLRMRIGRL